MTGPSHALPFTAGPAPRLPATWGRLSMTPGRGRETGRSPGLMSRHGWPSAQVTSPGRAGVVMSDGLDLGVLGVSSWPQRV